jgi:hypothetical protein
VIFPLLALNPASHWILSEGPLLLGHHGAHAGIQFPKRSPLSAFLSTVSDFYLPLGNSTPFPEADRGLELSSFYQTLGHIGEGKGLVLFPSIIANTTTIKQGK